jgi:hypothetical protein
MLNIEIQIYRKVDLVQLVRIQGFHPWGTGAIPVVDFFFFFYFFFLKK